MDKRWLEKEKQFEDKIRRELLDKDSIVEEDAANCRGMADNNTPKRGKVDKTNNRIKSPSDTTLYTPALKKTLDNANKVVDRELIDKISEFVESVRFGSKVDEGGKNRHQETQVHPLPGMSRQRENVMEEGARSVADRMILQG